MSEAREFPQLVQKGPGGAVQIVKDTQPSSHFTQQAITQKLVQRGPNGAFFVSNQ